MTTITAELNAAADARDALGKDRHIYAALVAWRRFIRAVKLALALTVLAALLLTATLPAGAQGPTPYVVYHYWYLKYSTGYGYSLACHYADRYGQTATWPGRVSGYSGQMYCPQYRITY